MCNYVFVALLFIVTSFGIGKSSNNHSNKKVQNQKVQNQKVQNQKKHLESNYRVNLLSNDVENRHNVYLPGNIISNICDDNDKVFFVYSENKINYLTCNHKDKNLFKITFKKQHLGIDFNILIKHNHIYLLAADTLYVIRNKPIKYLNSDININIKSISKSIKFDSCGLKILYHNDEFMIIATQNGVLYRVYFDTLKKEILHFFEMPVMTNIKNIKFEKLDNKHYIFVDFNGNLIVFEDNRVVTSRKGCIGNKYSIYNEKIFMIEKSKMYELQLKQSVLKEIKKYNFTDYHHQIDLFKFISNNEFIMISKKNNNDCYFVLFNSIQNEKIICNNDLALTADIYYSSENLNNIFVLLNDKASIVNDKTGIMLNITSNKKITVDLSEFTCDTSFYNCCLDKNGYLFLKHDRCLGIYSVQGRS